MESITKNKQNYAALAAIVRAVFGEKGVISGEDIKEMEGGYCNAVYLLRVPNTGEYVLKIAPPCNIEMMSYEKDMLLTEASVLRKIETDTGIPAPRVVYYDDSLSICSSSYFIMTKIDGEPYNEISERLSEEENAKIRYELGNYNRQINEIKGDSFGLYPPLFRKYSVFREFMLDLFRMVLDDGINAGSDLRHITYEAIWELILSKAPVFDEVVKPSLVHWDLWDGNVFIKDGRVSGIIDYERAMWGDPLMENGFSSSSSPLDESFVRGYGKNALTKEEQLRCSMYRLYRILVMIIECDYRKYSDDGQYKWCLNNLEQELKFLGN